MGWGLSPAARGSVPSRAGACPQPRGGLSPAAWGSVPTKCPAEIVRTMSCPVRAAQAVRSLHGDRPHQAITPATSSRKLAQEAV
jgi:hypothetical protein